MRKIWGLVLCMCFLFSGNGFAMQFSQPVEIGSVFVDQTGKQGILIKTLHIIMEIIIQKQERIIEILMEKV